MAINCGTPLERQRYLHGATRLSAAPAAPRPATHSARAKHQANTHAQTYPPHANQTRHTHAERWLDELWINRTNERARTRGAAANRCTRTRMHVSASVVRSDQPRWLSIRASQPSGPRLRRRPPLVGFCRTCRARLGWSLGPTNSNAPRGEVCVPPVRGASLTRDAGVGLFCGVMTRRAWRGVNAI
jgi:hypothetical protein